MSDAPVVPAVPTWKSTEFIKSAVVALFGLLLTAGILPSTGVWGQVAGILAAAYTAGKYSDGRSAVKVALASAQAAPVPA